MMADDMGLIDSESLYSNEMKQMYKRLGRIKESIPFSSGNIRKPLTDIKETNDTIIVTLEIPGIEKDDIEIETTDDELYIRAEKPAAPESEEESLYKSERSYGLFRRTIKLPCGVKREEAKASLHNGLLTVTLPKEVIISRTKVDVD